MGSSAPSIAPLVAGSSQPSGAPLVSGATAAPTSFITPWLVGPAVISQTGGNNYFDGKLALSHVLGASVTDPVTVKLFDKDCINEETDPTAVVSTLANVQVSGSYSYQVNIDQSKIGSDASGSGTYVSCTATPGGSCSLGNIEFCTRVSTYHGSIEIAFVETNFDLGFNLTDNDFSLPNVQISENAPDSFITDVDTDFDVAACQCDSFNCLASADAIEQDESLVMCIYPTHPTVGMANNVLISNFNIDVTDSTGAQPLTYQPVIFGTNMWVADPLTNVSVDGNDFVVMITTPIIAQFFIQNINTIDVGGNAFLEFKSAKGAQPVFGQYMMEVGLGEGTGFLQQGCFAALIARFRAQV